MANPTFTVPLAELDRGDVALAGGKGANLGAMLRAGLPVPPGFCVTVAAYRAVTAGAKPLIAEQLGRLDSEAPEALERASAMIRAAIEAQPMPEPIAQGITAALAQLTPPGHGSPPPVAVRSSATAEDLPDASFAGQQESFLNMRGADAVLAAVRRCWSSLWTPRAIVYRERNGFDHGAVALAVVVQVMIDAEAAGVLFTADPVSGRRGRVIVNGAWGLGEGVVSGLVSPDSWALGHDGAVIAAALGAKERMIAYGEAGGAVERPVPDALRGRPSLGEGQLRDLAALARAAEAHFGAPQDLEWALAGGRLYLLQSRPITTLFPLPEPAPADDETHIYLSINAFQGVMEPISPMGLSIFRELGAYLRDLTGGRFIPQGGPLFVEAGGRAYVDATHALRHPIGRQLIQVPFRATDPGTVAALAPLLEDGGPVPLHPAPRWTIAAVAPTLWRARPLLRRIAGSLRRPERAREATLPAIRASLALMEALSRRPRTIGERVLLVRVLLRAGIPDIAGRLIPLVAPGMASLLIAERLVRRWGLDSGQFMALRQGLAGNPTTEMDLALWRLAQAIKADGPALARFTGSDDATLAAAFRGGELPAVAQAGLADFLRRYGHRAVREIDVGMPRWSETPEYVINTIRNYLALDDPALAPDTRFAALERAAEQAGAALIAAARAQPGGALKAAALRFLIRRLRALVGLREGPKFYGMRLFALLRAILLGGGDELASRGLIERADDIFFLRLGEVEAVAHGAAPPLRALVAERRARHERELGRRPPRVLTSDGEVIEPPRPPGGAGGLRGAGVSPGVVEGLVRVIRDPHGARLEPGEILVAPSTDPAWTPLFLTAGGLVMEAGGMLSHGSVVAREYGIPAVVGVAEATARLRTGQRVRIDGGAGVVEPLAAAPQSNEGGR
jgi:pyruvate,water dikinase